ncbi:MAG: exodeoxyribonuclease VII small subunit [Lactobacillales bacterium]|nr:exodeoxyribonuclease VII small subunit [Lactobacillales bacterium]
MKFEEKIKELEKTINELENGEIDLEESINKYTSAMKLVKECDEQLNNIEKQVSKIVLENNKEEDFEVEE